MLDVGSEAVSSVAHATKQRLCEGQDVRQPFLKFGRQRRQTGRLRKFLHHAKLIDGKFRALTAGFVVQSKLKDFQTFRPLEDLLEFLGLEEVGFGKEIFRLIRPRDDDA